ncbi:MAG: lipid-binding SYLF domain-containing protein [Acidobacteriota bacterium]
MVPKMRARFLTVTVMLAGACAMSVPAHAAKRPAAKLKAARAVYQELMNAPDAGVPEALLEKAECIAVIPGVVKVAFIWGGRHGRGVISCRNESGTWSPPSFLHLTGGSFGLQIGAQATDVVLFVMTRRGAKALVKSEFTLGADASAAAGPVGRTAQGLTDITLRAGVYSYARAKGLFGGLSLSGARLGSSDKMIAKYYGKRIPAEVILFSHQVPQMTEDARAFLAVLP